MTLRAWSVLLLLVACEGGVAPPPNAGPQPATAAGVPVLVEPGALRAAIAAGVRARGENEASFEVDAFVAALVVEELAAGGGGLRVAPALEGGAQVGYRVEALADGSPYARIGLQVGDVIEAIGEVRLDSPGRAVGLLAGSGRGATIAVVRGGVGFTIEVRVAGGVAWDELLRRRGGAGRIAVSPIGQVPSDRPAQPPEEPPAEVEPAPPTHAGSGRPAGPAPRPSGGSASGGNGGSGSGGSGPTVAQCATAASCTLDRKAFDAAVDDPSSLSRQVAIAPTTGGYKLTRVAPGSQVAQLGFRTGDTIVSVNGNRLDDDLAALALYAGLGSTSRYTVVYERGGVRATKTVTLR